MKVIVCLPAYNEELAVAVLLQRIHEDLEESSLPHKVILVDDGSTDDTVRIAEEARSFMDIDIIRHEVNRGLGEAIITGLRHSMEIIGNRDVIVTMDADNSHAPGLILRMVRLIREGNDVVVASRYVRGANVRGVSFTRRALSYWGLILCRILFPTRNLRDYTSGYRAYRGSIILEAFDQYGNHLINGSGFSCMVERLLKLRSMDAIIVEVPLILRYDVKEGISKMKVGKTIKETLYLIMRLRIKGMRPEVT